MPKNHVCGDRIRIGDGLITCERPKNHPVVGFAEGWPGRYPFHHGSGWWNDRCASTGERGSPVDAVYGRRA